MNAKTYRIQRDTLQMQLNQTREALAAALELKPAPAQPQTCADVLKIIGDFLAPTIIRPLSTVHEGHKLWSVLTALRGPDSDSDRLKYATTSVIRWHAFKRTYLAGGPIINYDSVSHADRRKKLQVAFAANPHSDDGTSRHFWSHVTEAFEALGLSLTEVNDENR